MKVDILGIKIDNVTMAEAVKRVERMIEGDGQHQVVTPNPEHVVMAQEDAEFRKILNSADLAIPDGIGLVWAGGLKQRVTGTDLVIELCRTAAQKGWSVFLLGGQEGVAEEAAARLQDQFPGLIVSGTSSADPPAVHLPSSIFHLPTSDLLFVAYGAPTQEKWIARHLDQLPVKVAVGIGGAFDFVVGKQKRAPQVFQGLGLEWFWRLVTEPWRWRRQLRLVRFIVLVMGDMLQSRHDHG